MVLRAGPARVSLPRPAPHWSLKVASLEGQGRGGEQNVLELATGGQYFSTLMGISNNEVIYLIHLNGTFSLKGEPVRTEGTKLSPSVCGEFQP